MVLEDGARFDSPLIDYRRENTLVELAGRRTVLFVQRHELDVEIPVPDATARGAGHPGGRRAMTETPAHHTEE